MQRKTNIIRFRVNRVYGFTLQNVNIVDMLRQKYMKNITCTLLRWTWYHSNNYQVPLTFDALLICHNHGYPWFIKKISTTIRITLYNEHRFWKIVSNLWHTLVLLFNSHFTRKYFSMNLRGYKKLRCVYINQYSRLCKAIIIPLIIMYDW